MDSTSGKISAVRIPERIEWAVDLLAVQPADHILEIGCGSGVAIAAICTRLTRGTITAVDRSPTMVSRARSLNAECMAAGRAEVTRAVLEDMHLGRRFRKILAVNVNAFWTTPARSVKALATCLAPKGSAYLVYEPPSTGKAREIRDRLEDSLPAHGLAIGGVEERKFRKGYGLCIIAQPG